MPADTKDAVLALAGGEEELVEQMAKIISGAPFASARSRAKARALLPLIYARIAQAEQAATERAAAWHDAEAERCDATIKDCIARWQFDCNPGIFTERDTHRESAKHIRARNTEEDRSDG